MRLDSNQRSRVFIVCEPYRMHGGERISTVDLSPAAAWGEPIILLKSNQSLIDSQPTVEFLQEKLRDFSDDDFLVPIGDPILMCMATAIAADINGGRVRLLKWDRIQAKYIPIRLDIRT